MRKLTVIGVQQFQRSPISIISQFCIPFRVECASPITQSTTGCLVKILLIPPPQSIVKKEMLPSNGYFVMILKKKCFPAPEYFKKMSNLKEHYNDEHCVANSKHTPKYSNSFGIPHKLCRVVMTLLMVVDFTFHLAHNEQQVSQSLQNLNFSEELRSNDKI